MAFIQPPQGIQYYPAPERSRAVQSASNHGRSRLVEHAGVPKRRTKTGCKTCRKRRIKCDEGKPICNNCIKSSKECLGYDPPSQPGLRSRPAGSTPAAAAILPPQIAPAATRPDEVSPDSLQPAEISPFSSEHLSYGSALPTPQIGEFPGHAGLQDNLFPPLQYDFFHQNPSQLPGQHVFQSPEPLLQDSFSHHMNLNGHNSLYASNLQPTSGFVYDASLQIDSHDVFQGFSAEPAQDNVDGSIHPASNHSTINPIALDGETQGWIGTGLLPTASFADSQEQLSHPNLAQPKPTSNPAAFLNQWEDPDSPYDVDSGDDEQEKELGAHNQLRMLYMVNHTEQLHKINGLAYSNDKMNYLAEYRPIWTNSPLMNPVVARIFGHFVAITGPQLSLMERHPVNPAAFFTNGPVDPRYHSLWSYTLPRLALRNQALLQSMLAVSSLQIARIHKVPSTAARKHFLYANKKLNRDLQTPNRRTEVEAIAATLVMAYYHANRTEHVLWTSVLKGTAQLLSEVRFREQTHRVRAQSAILQAMYMSQADGNVRPLVDQNFLLQSTSDGLDEHLLSKFSGMDVSYTPPEPLEFYAGFAPLTQADLDKYNAKRDLFWLYCKQDIFQSFITRNPLLLPYKKWINCPPRAPLGRLNAIYGTSDHVMLLCGRVADFIARDQSRKLRVSAQAKIRDEQTKREIAKKRAASTLSRTSMSSSEKGTPGTSESPMLGMIPNVAKAELPSAFMSSAPRETFSKSPTSDSTSSLSMDEAERLALAEWQEIKDALALFEFSLSNPEWQSLPVSTTAPAYTPFGAALRFANYGIANIWLFFYTACIALERAHPDMPPAATVAATLRFAQTADYVKLIGRIVFGLQVPLDGVSVHPIYGACLSESMLPLFYAGVQLFDLTQRHAVIERLRWIATHVGMESAAQVAAGCEATWMALAARIPGFPPWTPVMNTEHRNFDSADTLVSDIDDLWLEQPSNSTSKQKSSSSTTSHPHALPDATQKHRVRIDRFEGKSFAGGIIGLEDDMIQIGAS